MAKISIHVPLHYENGIYKLRELVQKNEDCLELSLSEYDVLEYDTPTFNSEVRMYSVKEDALSDTMEVIYDEKGLLKKITYVCDGQRTLVYINMSDSVVVSEEITNYILTNAEVMAKQLLEKNGKVYRLFFDYFYDGEAVDYSAMIGFEADLQAIVDEYDGDHEVLDNSGNYPQENCVRADIDYLGVMLMCMDPKVVNQAFNDICEKMTDSIEKLVVDKLDKAEGFEIISGEYD
ncbi:MAG: hypothetical protein Q4D51_09225 [Eubacteriales bacterium]|nr:hypothetical protein [Eubacteriales bacterium]